MNEDRIVADVGSQRRKTRVERMSDSSERFVMKRETKVVSVWRGLVNQEKKMFEFWG